MREREWRLRERDGNGKKDTGTGPEEHSRANSLVPIKNAQFVRWLRLCYRPVLVRRSNWSLEKTMHDGRNHDQYDADRFIDSAENMKRSYKDRIRIRVLNRWRDASIKVHMASGPMPMAAEGKSIHYASHVTWSLIGLSWRPLSTFPRTRSCLIVI